MVLVVTPGTPRPRIYSVNLDIRLTLLFNPGQQKKRPATRRRIPGLAPRPIRRKYLAIPMPWEHRTQPLASRRTFARRLAIQLLLAAGLVGVTLTIGMVGYLRIGGLDWVDSFLESAMFLSGAGPIYTERNSTDALKLFSSIYALFSTLVVVSIVAIVASPVVHRVLHRLHLERGRE